MASPCSQSRIVNCGREKRIVCEGTRIGGLDLPPGASLPNLPRGVIVVGVLALIGTILLLTMFYTVEADEVAIVQRFGKYVRREEPGLRTKLPFGLETVRKVKVQRVLKAESLHL